MKWWLYTTEQISDLFVFVRFILTTSNQPLCQTGGSFVCFSAVTDFAYQTTDSAEVSNLTVQLDDWEFGSNILFIRLENLQFELFAVGLGTEKPISVPLDGTRAAIGASKKWLQAVDNGCC